MMIKMMMIIILPKLAGRGLLDMTMALMMMIMMMILPKLVGHRAARHDHGDDDDEDYST